ncbi:carbohydrate ABC transporter permease [Streptomyces adelaidensis]|uniref:carbohydrate ABC transporter permease n=1 Tax=Streptomyces adelaidensis TaxID=2796465 RepID=UPI00190429EA|nr:sugar ABC transporter permease [Streptomyces adelaidensis]
MLDVLQSGNLAGAAAPAGGDGRKSERRNGLLFVSPWLLGLLLFYIGPMIATLVMSFTDYHYVSESGAGTRFVGLDNWSRLFNDPMVAHSAFVTLKFALLFVPLSVLLPLALAYLMTARGLWARGFFRAAFFLPAIVPGVSALFVWQGFLNGDDGWLNRMLGVIGISGPNWLGDTTWVLPGYALIATWGVGNTMLIFTSALNGVPRELYEAATIDGAGPWYLFRHVTLPMISPMTFYNLVLTLVALGQYFVVPFVLTKGTGDPGGSGMFYTMYFYRETFRFYDAGYGSALAWMMFAAIMAATGLLFWSQRFWVHYAYEVKS